MQRCGLKRTKKSDEIQLFTASQLKIEEKIIVATIHNWLLNIDLNGIYI